MRLPTPRGPVSEHVVRCLTGHVSSGGPAVPDDVLASDDAQVALWMLYELHYRGFDSVDPDLEWDPAVLTRRLALERPVEAALREAVRPRVETVADRADVIEAIDTLVTSDDGPSVANHLHRTATRDELCAYLRERSIYHLKESDPHSFVLPRIDGAAKVGLAELQYDEYGAGRAAGLHSTLFGDALEAAGLDRTYGAYIDECSAQTLAVNNAMSLFGLHRRLRGAAMGHLAAFEATSSLPSRRIAQGVRRLGLPEVVAHYYDEHVEADAVHEQLAARTICGSLVADDPGLRDDVLLGVATCLELDTRAARAHLDAWVLQEAQ
ncbi:iron-containing redox enzyme family protein [Luteipulveratus halotolerans]|uniref:Iron-containing redox enzyme family protein n=1 Tax=Luteipulveratus halotolerans TaxID=1631356 RepID=A0A0L6CLT3_9MICO|nr:iron-containing redox enzyme family protein [Luteipulveratus halotolerans]KNX38712.1 hypothetical protein VV01_18710 [Luteipulveratus halotolerans]